MRSLFRAGWIVTAAWAGMWTGGCQSPTAYQPRPVELRKADEQDLAQAIAAYRGNVVLVDFWATWCDPCRRLFPQTVGLQRDLGPQGLRVVTVSLDAPGNEAQVRAFLERQGAVTENLLSRYDGIAESTERFDLPGAIPFVRIYDRAGNLRKQITGGGEEALTLYVRQLLAEK